MKIKYPKGIIKKTDIGEDLAELDENQLIDIRENELTIDVRSDRNFGDKAFYLLSHYNWIIVLDDQENLCLVPLKKK